MSTTTIDTLETAKELKAAGFDQSQAEALAKLTRRFQDLDLNVFATKPILRPKYVESNSRSKA